MRRRIFDWGTLYRNVYRNRHIVDVIVISSLLIYGRVLSITLNREVSYQYLHPPFILLSLRPEIEEVDLGDALDPIEVIFSIPIQFLEKDEVTIPIENEYQSRRSQFLSWDELGQFTNSHVHAHYA